MAQGDFKTKKPMGFFSATLICLVVAVVISLAGSYLGALHHSSAFSLSGEMRDIQTITARTAMQLYASQKATFKATVTPEATGAENPERILVLSLPISLWSFIPAIALFAGGYLASSLRLGVPKLSRMLPATFAGLVYGIAVGTCAQFLEAPLSADMSRVLQGLGIHFSSHVFSPTTMSSFSYGIAFGLIFTALGSMIPVRSDFSRSTKGNWRACIKGVAIAVLTLQLLITAAVFVWTLIDSPVMSQQDDIRNNAIKYLPSITSTGYSMIFGLSATEKSDDSDDDASHVSSYNTYEGLQISGSRTEVPVTVTILSGVFLVMISLWSGCLSVKYGSLDGSVPTSMRITLLQAAYIFGTTHLASLVAQTRLLSQSVTVSEGINLFLSFGRVSLIALAATLVFSFVGSLMCRNKASSITSTFTPLR